MKQARAVIIVISCGVLESFHWKRINAYNNKKKDKKTLDDTRWPDMKNAIKCFSKSSSIKNVRKKNKKMSNEFLPGLFYCKGSWLVSVA